MQQGRNRLKAMAGAAVVVAMSFGVAARAQTVPCAEDATYHQQDFALGEWDVFVGDRKTAQVRLEPVLAGCAIRETWTALSGKGNGVGLFTWSRVLKGWTYAWASDVGAATFFTGSAPGAGAMLYVTQRPTESGGTRLRHWTLTLQPDRSIDELSMGSDDGGKTWVKEYELVWKKPAQ
jgi:hypothetical protein